MPRPFCRRRCQGKDWRRAFPGASKAAIREFLSLFIGAFQLSKKENLKLNPSDEILAIYRATYPIQGMPDALELEILARDIQTRYGVALENIWTEHLTLGQLFSKTQTGMPS